MKQNYKLQITNYKLYFMGLAFCILIFSPLISKGAYKVYLKNGRVMTGVAWIKEEAGRVKINRNGIMLELPETSVIKIEEYNKIKTIKEESVEEAETSAEEETESIKEPMASEQQHKRPEELEKAGELPESAKPYKEFLDKLHKQKKLSP